MSTQDPVIDLVSGFQASQAISVFAELGIADLLKNDAQHVDAIAQATECYPRSLYRLLHMLASVGILEELAGQNFKLTALGECLRSDSPSKCSAWARYAGRPYVWQSWGAMMHSVKTGESAFGHLHGANLWEWRSKRRDETEIFDAAMSELSGPAGRAIASGYDFSVFDVIVDVGGGQGALLAAVLSQHKGTNGVLFDLPHVVAKSQEVLRAAGVADRCKIVAGDVFKAVPEGADAYLIKSVLVDEADDQAIAILKACRSAMKRSGKVVVIEHLLTPPNEPEFAFLDITMMIMTGGRERTREEFSRLFSAAGFNLEHMVATKSPFTLMVGAPA
jgi:hypothetical protein